MEPIEFRGDYPTFDMKITIFKVNGFGFKETRTISETQLKSYEKRGYRVLNSGGMKGK